MPATTGPSHDAAAELAVLGAMLLDIKAARTAGLILSKSDFFRPEHALTFEILDHAAQDDTAIDVMLLRAEMRRKGCFETAGGDTFLVSLPPAGEAAQGRVAHYAKIVKELAAERAVEAAASHAASALDTSVNGHRALAAEEFLDAERALTAIRETSPEDLANGTESLQLLEPFRPFIPLDAGSRPPFPTHVLPAFLQDWVAATTHALQVPAELPAMLGLSAIAAALAKKYEVQVRRGWREPLNLYTLTALEPGTRKSAAFAAAAGILYDYEAERADEERGHLFRAKAEYEALEKRVTGLAAARLSAKDKNAAEAEYRRACEDLEKSELPRAPTNLVGDDVTPERLVQILSEQGEHFAIFSAEGGILASLTGSRYAKNGGSNFDVLLKSHAGDPLSHDRKGGARISLRAPSLTLSLSVQPEILRQLAATPGAAGVGLLARFLYTVPLSTVGTRAIATTPVDDMTTFGYRTKIRHLLELPVPQKPETLTFNDEAQAAMIAFEASLEPRLHEDGDLRCIVEWASKLAGATARIAALFARTDEDFVDNFVERRHVENALVLTSCLTEHARFALTDATMPDNILLAKRIVAWIGRKNLSSFSAHQAFQALKSSSGKVQSTDDLAPGIRTLRAYGYIAPLRPTRTGPGRPTSETFAVAGNQALAIPP